MPLNEILSVVISASVIAALISALFSKFATDKSLKIENVTKERKEWRDRLRKIVVEITAAHQNSDKELLQQLESELIVRLNPEDKHDIEILESLMHLIDSPNERNLRHFNDRMAYLLKHDWERVKLEAGSNITSGGLAISTIFATFLLLIPAYYIGYIGLTLSVGVFLTVMFLIPVFFEYHFLNWCQESHGKKCKKFSEILLKRNLRHGYIMREKRNRKC